MTIEDDAQEDLDTLAVEILFYTVACAPSGVLGPEAYVACVAAGTAEATANEVIVLGGQTAIADIQENQCFSDFNCSPNFGRLH